MYRKLVSRSLFVPRIAVLSAVMAGCVPPPSQQQESPDEVSAPASPEDRPPVSGPADVITPEWMPAPAAPLPLSVAQRVAGFELLDGDVVAFLGDSNTASAIYYGKTIENYTHVRYPGRQVRFLNAGVGGDTAALGLQRLKRDVIDRGATVVIVMFGVNDVCWGVCGDAAHRQAYEDAIRQIVERSLAAGVYPYICSYAAEGELADSGINVYLKSMTEEGMAISRGLGGGALDVAGPTTTVLRAVSASNPPVLLHVGDHVHFNQLGHHAIAYAMLKGLGAPADVSSVVIDAAGGPKLISTVGAAVSELKGDVKKLQFSRHDDGLPITFGLPIGSRWTAFRWIPFFNGLDRYLLTVRNLQPGTWQVTVGGRSIGPLTDKQLAAGVNLTVLNDSPWAPSGPWEIIGTSLGELTDARTSADLSRRVATGYLAGNPNLAPLLAQLATINSQIEAAQSIVTQPSNFDFVLTRAGP